MSETICGKKEQKGQNKHTFSLFYFEQGIPLCHPTRANTQCFQVSTTVEEEGIMLGEMSLLFSVLEGGMLLAKWGSEGLSEWTQ